MILGGKERGRTKRLSLIFCGTTIRQYCVQFVQQVIIQIAVYHFYKQTRDDHDFLPPEHGPSNDSLFLEDSVNCVALVSPQTERFLRDLILKNAIAKSRGKAQKMCQV